ncbi:DUF4214 domain-containing protein [Pseudochelatococcus sp. B33]
MVGVTDIDLNKLLPGQGSTINGAAGWETGRNVSSAGDINGDGIDDFIVGAYFSAPDGREYAGSAYVIYGSKEGLADIDLLNLDAAQGFTIKGASVGDRAGASVSSAGDFNGDGIDDIIVGAYLADPDGRAHAGSAYVIYGQAGARTDIDLASLSSDHGISIKGAADNDRTGYSVRNLGDVNGDGIDDIVVGAYYAGHDGIDYAGAAYIIYGKAEGLTDIDLASLAATQGIVIRGLEWGHRVSVSVSGAGDVNGDGIADIVIGAEGANAEGRMRAGATYVIYGKNDGIDTIDLSDLAPTQGFTITGATELDYLGRRVTSAGDINNDGIDDLIVSTDDINGGESRGDEGAYVIYGKQGGPGDIDLSEFGASQGFRISGVSHQDPAAHHLGGAGDVNGDGIDDIIIGSFHVDADGRNRAGSAYVIFGKDGGLDDVDVARLTPADGFVIKGAHAQDFAGISVGGAGDVNGDGINDLLVGATGAGAAYVIFGRKMSAGEPIAGTNGTDIFRLVGDSNDAFKVYDTSENEPGAPILDLSGRGEGTPFAIDGLTGNDTVDVRAFKGTVHFRGGNDSDILKFQHGVSGAGTVFDGGDGRDVLQIHAAASGSSLRLTDAALHDVADNDRSLIAFDSVEVARLDGGAGDDVFDISSFGGTAAPGDNRPPILRAHIDGGLGHDVVVVAGNASQYELTLDAGRAVLRHTASGTTDVLTGIQQIAFDDGLVDLFSADHAQAAGLYRAFFGRDADREGFDYWLGRSAGGTDLAQMAAEFLQTDEFSQLSGVDGGHLIKDLYDNLLGRTHDADGLAYWTARVNETGRFDDVVLGFLNSAEFAANADHLIDDSLWASLPDSLVTPDQDIESPARVQVKAAHVKKLPGATSESREWAEFTFTVKRFGDIDSLLTVPFYTNTPVGSDFEVNPHWEVTFAAGEETKTITAVGPAVDFVTVSVALRNADNGDYIVDDNQGSAQARVMSVKKWNQIADNISDYFIDNGETRYSGQTISGNDRDNTIYVANDIITGGNIEFNFIRNNIIYGGGGDDNIVLSSMFVTENTLYGGSGSDTFTFKGLMYSAELEHLANIIGDFDADDGDKIALAVAGSANNFVRAEESFASYADAFDAANRTVGGETTYYFAAVGNNGFLFHDFDGAEGADHVLKLIGVTALSFDSIVAYVG